MTNTRPITAGIQGLTTQLLQSSGDVLPAAADLRDAGTAGGVPGPAALLRSRSPRRQCQGLTGGRQRVRPDDRHRRSRSTGRCLAGPLCRGHSGSPRSDRDHQGQSRAGRSAIGLCRITVCSCLTTGRTSAIGVLAPWISGWFFSAVIEGAQDVLGEQGYDTLLYPLVANAGSPECRRHQSAAQTCRRCAGAQRSVGS